MTDNAIPLVTEEDGTVLAWLTQPEPGVAGEPNALALDEDSVPADPTPVRPGIEPAPELAERWKTTPWPAGSGRPRSDETWLDIYRRQPQHPTAMFDTTAGPLRLGLCGADTGKGNPCAQPAGDHPDHLTLHGFPDVQLVRPEPEPPAAVHFVSVEFDGPGGAATVAFTCKAAPDAPCHMVCASECESCDHERTQQVPYCNPGEFIGNGGEGPISQAEKQPVLTFPADVTWNGDTYVWKVRDARTVLHHGDVLAALEQVYRDGAMGGEWPTLGADAVMEMARPLPTVEQIMEVLSACGPQRQIDEWPADYRTRQANAVLALLNGGAR